MNGIIVHCPQKPSWPHVCQNHSNHRHGLPSPGVRWHSHARAHTCARTHTHTHISRGRSIRFLSLWLDSTGGVSAFYRCVSCSPIGLRSLVETRSLNAVFRLGTFRIQSIALSTFDIKDINAVAFAALETMFGNFRA